MPWYYSILREEKPVIKVTATKCYKHSKSCQWYKVWRSPDTKTPDPDTKRCLSNSSHVYFVYSIMVEITQEQCAAIPAVLARGSCWHNIEAHIAITQTYYDILVL